MGSAVCCDWSWNYLSVLIIRSSPVAVPVPMLAIVELHYLDFCSHPDLKASEKYFSSIFCVFFPPEALQLSLSLFPPCFSSLSLISWLNKPLVSCRLSSSSFFHLPFPPFSPSFISYSLSLSASFSFAPLSFFSLSSDRTAHVGGLAV